MTATEVKARKDDVPAQESPRQNHEGLQRRGFLKGSAAVAAGASALSFGSLATRTASAASLPYSSDYGPLFPVADETTGLPLINLPEGFSYSTFGWTGDLMEDGTPTPGSHDGMAVVACERDNIVLVRNHEVGNDNGSFGPASIAYDPAAGGGCTNLMFNTRTGQWIRSWPSISGTIRNCAGGPTPWGSWLTCEESLTQPAGNNDLTETHGWVFEVPGFGPASTEPLTGLGRFNHEAAAVDPATGYVYLTEDAGTSGFYRFMPNQYGVLSAGGQLQMLKVRYTDNADFSGGFQRGEGCWVEWVDIDDPTLAHTPGTNNGLGVFMQGYNKGGAIFRRGEGCWYDTGYIYFVSTSGGAAGQGQVWEYDPRRECVKLVYESPSRDDVNNPDNIAVSPRGGILLCEDGSRNPQKLQGLSPSGWASPFAENQVILNGEKNNISGNFTGSEWAGATFAGRWLFVNIQSPGITFAITGPWDNGAL